MTSQNFKQKIDDEKNALIRKIIEQQRELEVSQRKLQQLLSELIGLLKSELTDFPTLKAQKPFLVSPVSLYMDIDSIIFDSNGNIRLNIIDFIQWCSDNFELFWMSVYSKEEIESKISSVFKTLPYAQFIQLSSKGDSSQTSIDVYRDFYWLTDKQIKSDISKLKDNDNHKRMVYVGKKSIDTIKKELYDRLQWRIKQKINRVASSHPADLYDSYSFRISWHGDSSWCIRKRKLEKFELEFEKIEDLSFQCKWLVTVPKGRNRELIKTSSNFPELYYGLDEASVILDEMLKEYEQSNNKGGKKP